METGDWWRAPQFVSRHRKLSYEFSVDKTVQKRSKKGRVFNYMPHLVWEKVSAANLHICEKFNLVPIFILSALEAG